MFVNNTYDSEDMLISLSKVLYHLFLLQFHPFFPCHPLSSTAPGSCVTSSLSWYILADQLEQLLIVTNPL